MPLLSRAAFNHFRRELQNFIQIYILINHICIIIIFTVLIVFSTCQIHESLLLTVSWIAHNDSWHPSPVYISFTRFCLCWYWSDKQDLEKEKKDKPLALNAEDAYMNFQSIILLYVAPGVKSNYFGRYSAYMYIQLNNQYIRLPDFETMQKTFYFSS